MSDSTPAAEPLDPAGFAELDERSGEGPVVMLNLLQVQPDGGAARYAEYAAAVAPLLERVGGRVLFAGRGATALIGAGQWDLVALVEYPTRAAFVEMIGLPEYGEIAHLRTEAIVRSELRPLDPESAETVAALQGG